MRSFLATFIIGILVGGIAVFLIFRYFPPEKHAPAAPQPSAQSSAANKPPQVKSDNGEAWNITPDNVEKDLRHTGRIVEKKAREVGGKIADAAQDIVLITTIKAKLALDSDLSARKIVVESKNGKVTLSGTVKSKKLIQRAVILALDTKGVSEVKSELTVEPPPDAAGN